MQSKIYSCTLVLVITLFLFFNIVYFQGYSDTHKISAQIKLNDQPTVHPQTTKNKNNNRPDVSKGVKAPTTTTNSDAIDNKSPTKDLKGNLATKSLKSSTVTNTTLPPPTITATPVVGLNAHEFNYILNPSKTCINTPDIELVICVPIARNNFAGRRAISETWGTYAYQKENKAALIFFIGNGTANEPPEIEARILNESRQFNDVVQQDYIDSYQNLSLKSISIIKWVSTYCPNVKFVLKADDDVYVNIPNLMRDLRTLKEKFTEGKFLMGYVIRGARPIRDKNSKWYSSPSQFPGPAYPRYVSGTTYAMTSEAAKLLYQAALRTPLFWLEDIYITGICRTHAGIAAQDTHLITYDKPTPSGCVFRKRITGHRYTEAQIRHIHKELYDKNLKC